MVYSSSTSSALVALLALTSVLSESATGEPLLSSMLPFRHVLTNSVPYLLAISALPTHRSSSAITRRAHIASHYDPLPLDKRTNLGDHSVYVDASTAHPGGQGGVRNSTINLTVVSKRDTTLSSFSRVVRSFFKRSSTSSSTTITSTTVPKLVALPQHTAAPYTKGHRTSRKQHQAQAALSRRSKAAAAAAYKNKNSKRSSIPDHPSPRIGVVVPPRVARPKNSKRNKLVERQNYEAGNEQASIYAAAIAAMDGTSTSSTSSSPSSQVTAQPVALNANSPLDSLSSTSLPPITLTMTLLPNGPNGEYVDAAVAALPTSTLLASDSASSPSIAIPTSLSEKLRQRRSTMADRKVHHHAQKRALKVKQEEEIDAAKDTSKLKRWINPKTGTLVSTPPTSTPTPASQVEPSPPKWTEIARF